MVRRPSINAQPRLLTRRRLPPNLPSQSSLNMPGFSVSLFLLPREGESKYSSAELLELLDAPADAPGWAWTSRSEPRSYKSTSSKTNTDAAGHTQNTGAAVEPTSSQAFIGAVQQACQDVIEAEPEITRYDTCVPNGSRAATNERLALTDNPFHVKVSLEMATAALAWRPAAEASSRPSTTAAYPTRTSSRPS